MIYTVRCLYWRAPTKAAPEWHGTWNKGNTQDEGHTDLEFFWGHFLVGSAGNRAPGTKCQFSELKNLKSQRPNLRNTCIPVADSCWCMAKPIQYCKVINLQLNTFLLKKKKKIWVTFWSRRNHRETSLKICIQISSSHWITSRSFTQQEKSMKPSTKAS